MPMPLQLISESMIHLPSTMPRIMVQISTIHQITGHPTRRSLGPTVTRSRSPARLTYRECPHKSQTRQTLQSRFSDEKCEKEEKSLQVRRWEESKKPEDWICGVGDNSPVRAEGDSHNYKFLPLQFFIMLWEHISLSNFWESIITLDMKFVKKNYASRFKGQKFTH